MKKVYYKILIGILLSSSSILAQRNWKPVGFGAAGNFLSVSFDSVTPGLVYACSDVTGIFRSVDYGETWEIRGRGLRNYEVASFAIDPFNNNRLYAGVGAIRGDERGGIHVSNDAGLTWSQLGTSANDTINFRRFRTLRAIAPDPYRQGVILSGSKDKGIWRSIDAGATWSNVFSAPLAPVTTNTVAAGMDDLTPNRAPISIVLFHPTDSNIVFAGADGYGILKSFNAGSSWDTINTGLPDTVWVKHLTIDKTGNVLYAACGEEGVYKTIDGGLNWTYASPNVPASNNDWVSSIVVHPTKPDTAYFTAATSNASTVWKTIDGGVNWVQSLTFNFDSINNPTQTWHRSTTTLGTSRAWHIDMDPFNSERLIYTEIWTMFKSEDGAATWNEKITGAQNTCVMDIFVDREHPANVPDTIWAAHMDAGLMRSVNQGASWEMISPAPNLTGSDLDSVKGHYPSFRIAIDGTQKYYYTIVQSTSVIGFSTVLRSTNSTVWEKVLIANDDTTGIWNNGQLMYLAVDPITPATIYAVQDGGNIYKSTSNGDVGTWTTVTQAGDGSYASITIDNFGSIFISTLNDGLWRSTDGGNSWLRVLTAETALVYKVKSYGNKVYATGLSSSSGESTQYSSSDGGITWNLFTTLLPTGNITHGGRTIAIDPTDSTHLVFLLQDHFSVVNANSIGVYESYDSGVSWNLMNDSLPNLNIVTLDYGLDGTLYAGTRCGAGIWKLPAKSSVGITSFSNYNLSDVFAFPNPAITRVTITVTNWNKSYTADIYNTMGQKVTRVRLENKATTINTEAWGSGMFYIQVQDENNNLIGTSKIMLISK